MYLMLVVESKVCTSSMKVAVFFFLLAEISLF